MHRSPRYKFWLFSICSELLVMGISLPHKVLFDSSNNKEAQTNSFQGRKIFPSALHLCQTHERDPTGKVLQPSLPLPPLVTHETDYKDPAFCAKETLDNHLVWGSNQL